MEKILEAGTKVVILSNPNQIDDDYKIGEVVKVFGNDLDKSSLSEILYVVKDNHGKLYKCIYYKNIMTIEEYKECLITQIENNNDAIKNLIEDNYKTFRLIDQFNSDIAKYCKSDERLKQEEMDAEINQHEMSILASASKIPRLMEVDRTNDLAIASQLFSKEKNMTLGRKKKNKY
jgi:hypothetical protein